MAARHLNEELMDASQTGTAAISKSRDEIAAAYSSPSWWYDVRGFLILTFAYNSTLGQQIRFFGPSYGARHLDVACGTGTLLGMIVKWRGRKRLPPSHIVAVDYADSMLDGTRRRFQGRTDVEVARADAARLPYDDDSFDSASIANALHCLSEFDAALRDIHRVLKPGGTFSANVLLHPGGMRPLRRLATVINAWGMKKGILFRPYSEAEIRAAVSGAGFEIRTDFVSGNCYFFEARKPLAEY
jgi:ubiquinone/menaquinone biosynthesis C-methylase UbiE